MTIFESVNKSLTSLNCKHVADTTVYNIRLFQDTSKTSNLAKLINSLPKLKKGRAYLIVVGAKGRSQHSATDLHVFDAPCNNTIGTYECCFRQHWFK